MSSFKSPIKEFLQLSNNNIYSIDKIEWWLLKYSELYDECKCDLSFLTYVERENEEGINQFRHLYVDLSKMADIHKYESYCENLLKEYDIIKDNLELVKNWMRNNEKFYNEYEFKTLDRMTDRDCIVDLNLSSSNLEMSLDYDKVDEIFLIDCRDFKYILEFTRIFYHLFWIKELLPDRIKSIEDDIKKSDEIKY